MRMLAFSAVVLLAASVALFGFGCGDGGDGGVDGGDGQTADEHFADAMVELQAELSDLDGDAYPWEWEADLTDALDDLEAALDADPNHEGALFMSALTRLAMVMMDPDLGDIMDGIFDGDDGPSGPRAPFFWYLEGPDPLFFLELARSDRPDDFPFSEMQAFIEGTVIPALDYADDRLTRFEDLNGSFEIQIVTEGKREVIVIDVDATDAYFLHAPLDAAQATSHALVTYNVDMEATQSLEELLEDDPDFLTLRGGGHMPAAYDELLEMAGHLFEATVLLDAEVDAQGDDVFTKTAGYIPLEDEELFGPGAVDSLRIYAGRIEDALVDGLVINPGDYGGPSFDITVDFEQFFTNPMEDIRDYLPAHEVPWPDPDSTYIFRPIDLPDPTLNGFLPGMTDGMWEDLFQWVESD